MKLFKKKTIKKTNLLGYKIIMSFYYYLKRTECTSIGYTSFTSIKLTIDLKPLKLNQS